MRIKVSRAVSSVRAVGMIAIAMVILAAFADSAGAVKPGPSPSPTPTPAPTPMPSPTPTPHFTDVGVSVVKEEQITTQTDVTSTHAMAITVTNAGYPADVRLTLLAVSKLGVCEARLLPVVSDYYIEFETDEDKNGVPETLFSELDIYLTGVAAGETRTLERFYSLICRTASPPANPYEIQADVLPLAPVVEADLGNPPPCPSPWCVPAVTGGPQSPSDNVHKNFPSVIITTFTPPPATTPTPAPTPAPTCPDGFVPPWIVLVLPGDVDCDGFTDSQEAVIGTDAAQACGVGAWPVDNNDEQHVGLADVLAYIPYFNGTGPYSARFDLNTDSQIGLPDVLAFIPYFGQSCTA